MQIINAIYKYKTPVNWSKRSVNQLRHIVVHHSAYAQDNQSSDSRLRALMAGHTRQGWAGLSYHYAIMRDGQIYQLNNDDDLTWTDSHNTYSLSILVDGYFHTPKNEEPSQAQLDSLHYLSHTLRNKYNIMGNWLLAHRDIANLYGVASTACCGDLLYKHLQTIKFKPLLNMSDKTQLTNYRTAKVKVQEDPRFNKLGEDEKNAFMSWGNDSNEAPDLQFLMARIIDLRDGIINLQENAKIEKMQDMRRIAELSKIIESKVETQDIINKNKFDMDIFAVGGSKNGALYTMLGGFAGAAVLALSIAFPDYSAAFNLLSASLAGAGFIGGASNGIRNVNK